MIVIVIRIRQGILLCVVYSCAYLYIFQIMFMFMEWIKSIILQLSVSGLPYRKNSSHSYIHVYYIDFWNVVCKVQDVIFGCDQRLWIGSSIFKHYKYIVSKSLLLFEQRMIIDCWRRQIVEVFLSTKISHYLIGMKRLHIKK